MPAPCAERAGEEDNVNERLSALGTEGWRKDLADLDLRSTTEMVAAMNAADAEVHRAVADATPAIAAAVDGIAAKLRAGGRLLYVGAGTPGRLCELDAAECPPTFNVDESTVQTLIAGAHLTGREREAAEDDGGAGEADLRTVNLTGNDAVVGVTASGRTPYVRGAIAYARSLGAFTVGLSNNSGSTLSGEVEVAIEVLTGPEVLLGSTRLKAGTGQKMVLNMLSTLSMVSTGHTFGNLMIDVRADNLKLRVRAAKMVALASGVSEEEAAAVLEASGFETRTAVVAITSKVSPDEARKLLAEHGGDLRAVVGAEIPGAAGPA
jgi:N-acetylmuramic acid 6-phosphate etherase